MGCVCVVVGDGVVLSGRYQVHLSDADDCFVGVGSGQANFMSGDGGLFAGGGDDLICAGDSADSSFFGGDGTDTMHAGGGDDEYFYGSYGADALDAGGGDDQYFYGGDGDDVFLAGAGYDKQFHGGDGDDALYAGETPADNFKYFYGARLPPSARPRRAPAAAPSCAARAPPSCRSESTLTHAAPRTHSRPRRRHSLR